MEDAARLLQLVVNGAAAGCIYGLIALGFVLIYKATEMVNFAQGDIMMLGGFFAFALIAHWGLPYWIGALLAIALTAAFGYALDAVLLRRIIGQPQFAVVMLTLGLGFIFRAAAGITWGYDSVGFNTPFTNRTVNLGGLVIGQDNVSIIVGTVLLCLVLYVFFSRTRLGVAMQASSQNQLAAYYMGIPVRRVFSLIWAISAGVAALAGILLSPVSMIDVNMGFLGIKAFAAAVIGGFGSIPGALVGGVIVGIVEQLAGYYLPAGFQEVSANTVLLATLFLRPQGLFAESMGEKGVAAMRYLFRTAYRQDVRLWRHRGDLFWYGLLLLALLVIPYALGEFYVGELGAVFIFAIAGVGLMLLVGYTGLISLGHAAFLGIGAYTNSVLLAHGVPFLLSLPAAGLFTAMFGAAIGLPTLRMSGLYLAIATLAFGSIVGTVLQKWDAVTGGFDGYPVPTPSIFGMPIDTATRVYYVSLAVLLFVLWLSVNLLRTPIGRAMVAIRDSEISAQSMGINLARYKTFAFAISAFMTGLAGALFAHYVRFLAPDSFDILLSVQFVTIVFVGGLGSLHGAIFGALFVRLLPQAIAIMRDDLPFGIGRLPGLEPSLFGLVLVLVILFFPGGIYGLWLKLKHWFQAYPFKRRTTFRRQKSYARSERLR